MTFVSKMTYNFWRLCAISVLKISKNHFATFDFFVKMKLVSTVHKSTSQSKSGYPQPANASKKSILVLEKRNKDYITLDFVEMFGGEW